MAAAIDFLPSAFALQAGRPVPKSLTPIGLTTAIATRIFNLIQNFAPGAVTESAEAGGAGGTTIAEASLVLRQILAFFIVSGTSGSLELDDDDTITITCQGGGQANVGLKAMHIVDIVTGTPTATGRYATLRQFFGWYTQHCVNISKSRALTPLGIRQGINPMFRHVAFDFYNSHVRTPSMPESMAIQATLFANLNSQGNRTLNADARYNGGMLLSAHPR